MKKTEVIETTYELDDVKIKEERRNPGLYTIYIYPGNGYEMLYGLTDNMLVSLKHLIQEIIDDKKKNNGDIL